MILKINVLYIYFTRVLPHQKVIRVNSSVVVDDGYQTVNKKCNVICSCALL